MLFILWEEILYTPKIVGTYLIFLLFYLSSFLVYWYCLCAACLLTLSRKEQAFALLLLFYYYLVGSNPLFIKFTFSATRLIGLYLLTENKATEVNTL